MEWLQIILHFYPLETQHGVFVLGCLYCMLCSKFTEQIEEQHLRAFTYVGVLLEIYAKAHVVTVGSPGTT